MTFKELEDDVESLAEERISSMSVNPSRYVYTKIRVLFEDADGRLLDQAGEFDAMDAPECVLQEAVFGKALRPMLSEKGAACLSNDIRIGFGLPDGCRVAGVMFSSEAIYATRSSISDKEKRVRGYPFLLVSGQTRAGLHKTILRPLLMTDEFKVVNPMIDMPNQVKDVIKNVENAPAFLNDFFSQAPKNAGVGVVIYGGLSPVA